MKIAKKNGDTENRTLGMAKNGMGGGEGAPPLDSSQIEPSGKKGRHNTGTRILLDSLSLPHANRNVGIADKERNKWDKEFQPLIWNPSW